LGILDIESARNLRILRQVYVDYTSAAFAHEMSMGLSDSIETCIGIVDIYSGYASFFYQCAQSVVNCGARYGWKIFVQGTVDFIYCWVSVMSKHVIHYGDALYRRLYTGIGYYL